MPCAAPGASAQARLLDAAAAGELALGGGMLQSAEGTPATSA
jgi:hypothetical protein